MPRELDASNIYSTVDNEVDAMYTMYNLICIYAYNT